MANHPKIGVILNLEGTEALSKEPFFTLTARKGGALNCDTVEDRGYFQRLTIPLPPHDGKVVTFEIDIPTHYILYMLSAVPEARGRLGFTDE
jgi:hypothetical protein